MLKAILSLKTISLVFATCLLHLGVFSQEGENYYRFLDSVDIHIDTNSAKSLLFLDSIPKPVENFIEGRVGEYYADKALIHDDYKEYSKFHQCTILALKYAEKEEDYCIAGQACIDLFSDNYFVEKDELAFKYLDLAKMYFGKCDDPNGLVLAEQMYAYAKFLNGELKASNALILPKLEKYKNIKDDAYYYMFALYMLTSNYIYLNDIKTAEAYLRDFKTLENDSTIAKYNYLSFDVGITLCLAEYYQGKKQMDSTLFYLEKSSQLKPYMGVDVLKDYFKIRTDIYKSLGNIEQSKAYIDSLIQLEDKMYKSTVDASFQINEALLKAETELISKSKRSTFNQYIALALFGVLLLLSIFYFIFHRNQKSKIKWINDKADDLSYLKSNNEQLSVKVQGLEEYINNLKKEVKAISFVGSVDAQKKRIKELYKSLHINSATLLDKSDSHLELVNDLNIGFFKKIDKLYPQLNKSEVIICYYILIGFTNKEIAVFLNTTVRSVESKRYRISKKIGFNKDETTLLKHLQHTFKDTVAENAIDR